MIISQPCLSSLYTQPRPTHEFSGHHNSYFHGSPGKTVSLVNKNYYTERTGSLYFSARPQKRNSPSVQSEFQEGREFVEVVDYDVSNDNYDDDGRDGDGRFSARGRFGSREEEKDFDKDPEFAEILGTCLENPQKAQEKMDERLRKKRHKIVQTKTGSAAPMKVTLNKFDFSNAYIWFEFYNAPLEKDVTLICDTIRAWHIIGRLGGCNSMNMQLSQSTFDKRPTYDAIQGANTTPATFYNIGDFVVQDNLARIWIDIGTSEPLLLDILINALTQISSDYVGIKQLIFGGSEFENWKENFTSEDAGCSIHKI